MTLQSTTDKGAAGYEFVYARDCQDINGKTVQLPEVHVLTEAELDGEVAALKARIASNQQALVEMEERQAEIAKLKG